MPTESVDGAELVAALDALRREVARLGDRVAALEADATKPVVGEGVSEEVVLVICAAVAAYLGVKAPVRQIRLVGSSLWAQEGRATLQASHAGH